MDIEALRTLCAFVETGSFTRAAKHVHRTQSTVSMQMKKLEQDLGQTLFEKQGRQLVLTASGNQLVSYAKQLINLHDEACKQIKTAAGSTRVRLGCPDDYSQFLLPKVVKALHQTFQTLDLHVTTAPSIQLRAQLDQGLLDLVIATRSPDSEEGYFLHASKGVWVKSPQFCYQPEAVLPIALFGRDCKFHQASSDGLLKANRLFKLIASCGSLSALQSIVQQSIAIASMADISVQSDAVIINDESLPELPVIDIVLLHGSHPNNPIKYDTINQILSQLH